MADVARNRELQFQQWLQQLTLAFDGFSDDWKGYVQATGAEAWRESFEDGLTAVEAFEEEVCAHQDSFPVEA